jgi:hypothetical protein
MMPLADAYPPVVSISTIAYNKDWLNSDFTNVFSKLQKHVCITFAGYKFFTKKWS